MTQCLTRLSDWSIVEVMNLVAKVTPTNTEAVIEGTQVHMDSDRYKVFSESTDCKICGLKGTRFSLESCNQAVNRAHFNLYAVDTDGNETLMTKGRFSTDRPHQTTCQTCRIMQDKEFSVQQKLSAKQG